MVRQLYLSIIGLFFGAYNVSAQEIAISHDAVSPYTPGSSIAVLVEINNTTCIRPGNKFGLYLSDATGSFINETQIGTFDGFYTTFINGVIPASAVVGTGYRLRVKSSLPALISNSSNAFEISQGAAVSANITSSYINPSNTDIFGLCSGINNHTFYLSNESTAGSSVIASVKNELNGNVAIEINFDAQVKPFVAQLAHYTIYVSARMSNGTIGTKAYMIINNRTLTAFGTSGNNTVCLPNAVLDFNVTVSGTDGIENNFPGNIYRINWGDGQENLYTFCDIKNSNGKMSHEYTENSCGRTIVSGSSSVYNAFGVNISTFNSYCGDVGTPVSTFAKVINKPQNDFTNSGACLNQPAVFTNTSIPGQDPNSTASGCGNNAVTYTWYVDGQVVPGAINRPISFPLTYTFTKPGKHVVRLESSSNTACPAEAKEDTVCVQEPPRPSFTINGNSTGSTVCANTTLKPVNTSFTDNTCGTNTYNWTVSGGNVVFENNTGTTSAEPEIKFVQPGVYKIRLTINSSACTAVSTEEYILVVNNMPTVSLSPDLTSCNLSSYNFNNTTSGPTRVEFSGTAEPQSNTYTWTVTGGAYAFIGGTGQNSKFPVIDFTEYATYTITVTHQNNCGTVSAVQNITFEPAPTVNAGTYDAICFNGSVNLNGTINGTVNSFEWVGGMGVFLPDRNTLNANYTPTEAERQSGRVDLTLRATTNLASPCNVVEGFTTINIIAPNRITSEASKNICTANQVDYMPIATVTGSTFSWAATGSANASGFSAGSGTIITDRLVNDSNSSPATVTYTITPFYEGCTGEPFNLTVIVMPKPAVTVTVENISICSGQKAVIRLSPSLPNTTYTWTSSVSDPLISGNSETSIALSITQIEDILFNKSATAGTVTYQITPISSDGCAGDTESISITVKAGAPNTISTNQTICEGTAPVPLTGNIPTGGDGPYTYQWQLSTDNGVSWANIMGAESEGYSPPVLNVTTVYRRVVNSFSCPGSVPNYSNEITITVSADAEAAFNFLADKGCAPFLLDNNNIKAVSYPDRNGNYIWYVDDIQIGTGINFPGYTINEGDDTVTVKLVVTSSLGCKQAEMSHDFITQKTLLSAFTQDKTEGCGPLDVNFTNTSSPMLNTTFFWDFGNGQTSAQIQPGTITFLPDPGGKDKLYTVTLTASSACSPAVVYTSTVLVRAQPLSVFSPDRTISCSPMVVNFSNTSPEASNTTYTFDFGDGSPSVTTTDRRNVTHTFTTGDQTSTYTITMTARSGCGEHTSQHTISVTPGTVVAELVVNSTDQSGCVPFTVPFYNNSSGANVYRYDFGDGTTLNTASAPERITHTYNTPGDYTVTLTASNGCSTVSTSETITVLPLPQTSFEIREAAYVNIPLRFNNTSTGSLFYLWDFGDGNTSAETNPEYTYRRQGIYKVTLTATNSNNCSSTYILTVQVAGEPGELFLPNSFIPNSVTPELREFKAKGFGLASYKLSIFNKWGELLWESTELDGDTPAEGWDGTFRGSPLPQGVYFWKMQAVFKNGQVWEGMSYDGSAARTTGILNLIR